MNKEDYVSLEVAKMLKKKGFNEPCNMAYDEKGNTCSCDEFDWNNEYNWTYSCPTMYQVQKWLIYERGWFVDVSKGTDGWHTVIYPTEPNASCAIVLHKNYGTYEQALSEGILEALKLI